MVEKHQVGRPYHSQARLKRHRALRPRRRRPRRNTTFLCILLPIKTTYPARARPALQVPGQCVAGGCQMRCGSAKTNEPAPPDALYGRFAFHVRTKMQTCNTFDQDLPRYGPGPATTPLPQYVKKGTGRFGASPFQRICGWENLTRRRELRRQGPRGLQQPRGQLRQPELRPSWRGCGGWFS